MNTVLDEVDVLVLPSYYNEGVPKILLEGLSKGLPIITTDWVGCRETVKEGVNGYLIEPKNVQALESAMEKMILLSLERRNNMRVESRKMAESEFGEEKVLRAYIAAIS
jgi:glycosyltransferase involved in cell wall biosynthesis